MESPAGERSDEEVQINNELNRITFNSDAKITEESFVQSSKRLDVSHQQLEEQYQDAPQGDITNDSQVQDVRNLHLPRLLKLDTNQGGVQKSNTSRPSRIQLGSRGGGDKIFSSIKQWSPVYTSQQSQRRLSKQDPFMSKTMQTKKVIQLKKTELREESVNTQPSQIEGTSSMHQIKNHNLKNRMNQSDAQMGFLVTNSFSGKDKVERGEYNGNSGLTCTVTSGLFSDQNRADAQKQTIIQFGVSEIQPNRQITTGQPQQVRLKQYQSNQDGTNMQYIGIMTSRDQQKFLKNPKKSVYIESKSIKQILKPLQRTPISKKIPNTLAASPSAKHLGSVDNRFQNDIKNAFDSFELKDENKKGSESSLEKEHHLNQVQEKLKTLQTRISKKTLLQASTRQINAGQYRQQKHINGENIESVFAKRSIDKLIMMKPSTDSTSSQFISQRTITPSEINEKAFGMTLLKQFPSASMAKEIYRSKIAYNKRLAKQIHQSKDLINQSKQLNQDSQIQESMEENSTIKNQEISLNEKSAICSINDGYKVKYHLNLKRINKEKREQRVVKSQYININDNNQENFIKQNLKRIIGDEQQDHSSQLFEALEQARFEQQEQGASDSILSEKFKQEKVQSLSSLLHIQSNSLEKAQNEVPQMKESTSAISVSPMQSLNNQKNKNMNLENSKIHSHSIDNILSPAQSFSLSKRNSLVIKKVESGHMNFCHEKSFLNIIQQLERQNRYLEDDLKNVQKGHKDYADEKSQNVFDFFKNRDQKLKKIFDDNLNNQQIQEHHGIPKVFCELLQMVFRSFRSDQEQYIKYLTKRFTVMYFHTSQMRNDVKVLTEKLKTYQQQEAVDNKYKKNLFEGVKFSSMNQEIWDFEQRDIFSDFKKPDIDEISRANTNFPLARTLESLEKQIAKISDLHPQENIQSVPFDYLQLLMNKKTTSVQKKTAFKILQRYYKNTQTQDFGQEVNLDYEELQDTQRAKLMNEILMDKKETLEFDKLRMQGELDRALDKIVRLTADVRNLNNTNDDLNGQLNLIRQGNSNLQTQFDQLSTKSFKDIQKIKEEKYQLEYSLNDFNGQISNLKMDNVDKHGKLISKSEKIIKMKKNNKDKRSQQKESSKEYFDKCKEAYNMLKLLKSGVLTLDDLPKDFFLGDFVDISSSDGVSVGSEEEFIARQNEIFSPDQSSNFDSKNTVNKNNISDSQKIQKELKKRVKQAQNENQRSENKKQGKGGGGEESDYYDDDGKNEKDGKVRYNERSIGRSKRKSKHVGGTKILADNLRTKKSENHNNDLDEDETSEEEVMVDGVKILRKKEKKERKHRKTASNKGQNGLESQIDEEDDVDTSYEIDQKTGKVTNIKKKKRARTLEQKNNSRNIQLDNKDLSEVYITETSENGTKTRILKKQHPNTSKSKKTVNFNEDSDSLTPTSRKNSEYFDPQVNNIKSNSNKNQKNNKNASNPLSVKQNGSTKFYKQNKYDIVSNHKETQTQISGPVIQSNMTESIFNQIDQLEKKAAMLKDRNEQSYGHQKFNTIDLNSFRSSNIDLALQKQLEEDKIKQIVISSMKTKSQKYLKLIKSDNNVFKGKQKQQTKGKLMKAVTMKLMHVENNKNKLAKSFVVDQNNSSTQLFEMINNKNVRQNVISLDQIRRKPGQQFEKLMNKKSEELLMQTEVEEDDRDEELHTELLTPLNDVFEIDLNQNSVLAEKDEELEESSIEKSIYQH